MLYFHKADKIFKEILSGPLTFSLVSSYHWSGIIFNFALFFFCLHMLLFSSLLFLFIFFLCTSTNLRSLEEECLPCIYINSFISKSMATLLASPLSRISYLLFCAVGNLWTGSNLVEM